MACGRCGCKDICGGSSVPDICRRCGAIEGPSYWYYDIDNSNKFDPKKYDEEHKMDNAILTEALIDSNVKMFDNLRRSANTPSPDKFEGYSKEVSHLVTLTRHKVRMKVNLKCGDIKKILENVPDDAVLTGIDIDDDFLKAELYFDVETQG